MRRFRAASSKEALLMVRRELGPEALIVETRRLTGGLTEVVAVIDNEDAASSSKGLSNPSAAVVGRIEDEMREIKELLLSISLKSGGDGEAVTILKKQMLANGLGSSLTAGLLAGASKNKMIKKGSKAPAEEMAMLREAVRGEIREKIRVKDPLKDARVLSFIGPTGAGKTTTIAKLAAISVLKNKKKVALLTMDTLRIGAPEQLKTYARIMGVPVGVAATTAELAAFLKIHGDKELILIDTPGKDVRKSDYLRELQEMTAITPELKFNLVLSIRDRDESLIKSVKGLSALPVDTITFTKLDESGSFGQMLGVSRLAGKPISYLGTGQRIPEDLLAATKQEVLKYLMPA
ncbi:MAG: hypothetical protein ACE5DW_00905 [Thermodesulfobacteriota bacterium]